MTQSQRTPFEHRQEVRFVVVMYGGVSLAIYINGVTQELFRLVRATAPAGPMSRSPTRPLLANHELSGSERVYRKLGQLLGSGKARLADVRDTDPIRTRFVIDILSGTSAGGINAVFLAKALANNQSIDDLKQMWIREGEIARLINDKQSVNDLPGLAAQEPPKSLLSSQRMYRKLLDALEGMEKPTRSRGALTSPYVEELDLFVTATDIRGLTLPLRLADRVVYERRYRHVFHFLYTTEFASGGDRNDFRADNNPFLAFAARCTSAFPFAFEPMALSDIDEALSTMPPYSGNAEFSSDGERWKAFFKDYLRSTGGDPSSHPAPGVDYRRRAFGDGGYLDNKPFSYATDTLLRRRDNVPVDRKLIYIEPSPEHPESDPAPDRKPDAIENVIAALLTLPHSETIRQDIERVLERNRLIERVSRMTRHVERDVARRYKEGRPEPATAADWVRQDLAGMIETKGVSYGAYHRLKVASLTDELASLIARVAGFDERSDHALAIRYLVRIWRQGQYVEYHQDQKPTENKFLLDFDFSFRLRRLNFLRRKINELCRLDEQAREIMRYSGVNYWPETESARRAFQDALLTIKRGLNETFVSLRRAGRRLRSRHEENPLRALIADARIASEDLHDLLSRPTEAARFQHAARLLQASGRAQRFQAIAETLAEELRPALIRAADECRRVLAPAGPTDAPAEPAVAARQCLWHYYRYYDDYDMIMFPILHSAGVGETDVVEIIRISPEDAPSLIDERHSRRRKLAGTALAHFGAFLDQLWRQNDMLWGRLDAAERLITALVPDHPDRAALIEEAHEAILAEEIQPQDRTTLCRLLVEALMRTRSGDARVEELIDRVEKLSGSPIDPRLQALLRSCLDPQELLRYFRQAYEVNRQLAPGPILRSAARATQVVGKMLEDLADRHRLEGKRLAWVTRLGQLFWGLVEVAVPRSIPNLLFRYWLKLLYLFEALLIVGGLLLGMRPIQRFGWIALGITLAVNLGVFLLSEYLRGKKAARRAIVVIAAVALTLLAALGLIELRQLLEDPSGWLSQLL